MSFVFEKTFWTYNPSSVYTKPLYYKSYLDLRNRLMCSLTTPLLSSLANAFVTVLSVTPEINNYINLVAEIQGPKFLFQQGQAKSHKDFPLQPQNPHTADNESYAMTPFPHPGQELKISSWTSAYFVFWRTEGKGRYCQCFILKLLMKLNLAMSTFLDINYLLFKIIEGFSQKGVQALFFILFLLFCHTE